MPSSYTTSLRLVLPVEGDLVGEWGTVVNNGLTSLVDSAVAGSANITMTDANYTLTVVDEAPDEARQMFINLSGSLTTTRNVICPSVSKLYFVHNNTNQSIVFKTSAGSGVTVLTTTRVVLYCNGTDVVDAINALAAGTTVGGAAIATTSSAQTLTNKTISADNNTISGIAASSFVLSNASGNLDGTVAQKAIPTGVVVGTTDTQTLTNKTIAFGSNTLTDVASTNTAQTLTNKTISGSNNTITNVSLTTGVTGTLPIANGGTNATTASEARTSLGGTTLGANLFTITNPSAVTFPRFNADNTVSALNAADFRTAIGAGTGSGDVTTNGTQTLTNKTIAFGSNTLTDVASTNTTQTLTNKTISADNNTISGIAASSFVLSNASGNVDGAAAQKAIPTGVVVGTTDVQTLTNKTINGSDNTITNVSLTTGVTGTLPIANGGTNATTASDARTSLGGTTLGANLFTITNPSAVTFPRFNADNTVSSLSAADFRTAIGAGTGNGDVTTAGAQTLTNKTISVDDNTISGIAASSFVLSNASGNVDGAVAQKAIPAGVVVGTTDTQTLTNKRVTPRVNAQTTTTSPWAWNSDSFDQQEFTALANALTINADAGNPTDGQKTIFRFQDNGTARALTWTTGTSKSFRAIGVTLPTTTVLGKTVYIGCIYNSGDARWDVIAVAQEA